MIRYVSSPEIVKWEMRFGNGKNKIKRFKVFNVITKLKRLKP